MATSDVKVTEGSGKNVAAYSLTEDAETKQVQRVAMNDSTGMDATDTVTHAVKTSLVASSVVITVKTNTSSTGMQTNVTSSASDGQILAANANRLGATIYNDSTQVLYLLFANAVSSITNYSVQVLPQGFYEFYPGYTGIVKGLWASANGAARVTEFS
jgi:hypothetical protein